MQEPLRSPSQVMWGRAGECRCTELPVRASRVLPPSLLIPTVLRLILTLLELTVLAVRTSWGWPATCGGTPRDSGSLPYFPECVN